MRALPLVLAFVLAACGAEEREARAVREAPAATLEVRMALPGGPIYVEGSLPTVRVERLDGSVVFEKRTPVGTLDEPLLERVLEPGGYVVDVVQQPCAGNCGMLDPVDEGTRCRVRTALRTGRTTIVTVRLSYPDGGDRVTCEGEQATRATASSD